MESSHGSDKKVAIVTGSTSGIGVDLAEHLYSRGYRLGLTGRRRELGESVAKRIDSTGEDVVFVECDVSSYEDQGKLFRVVWDRWRRIDVFIANAGIVDAGSIYSFAGRNEPVTSIPPAPDLSCTEVNYKGPIYGSVLAIHFMRHNPTGPGGKIIITSSMMAVHPCGTFPEYSGAKAGVINWARAMAPVLRQKGNITINSVLMGPYDTGIMPGFANAFLPKHVAPDYILIQMTFGSLTPKECFLAAYDAFLNDSSNTITGQAVEPGHDKLYWYEIPEYKSGEFAWRNDRIFEPWFVAIHGQTSEVKGALKAPPNQETGELFINNDFIGRRVE